VLVTGEEKLDEAAAERLWSLLELGDKPTDLKPTFPTSTRSGRL